MMLRASRFYGILDTGYVTREQLLPKCKALLAGGADVIQLRAKKEDSSTRRAILAEIIPLFDKTSVPLIVNDDLEAALAFPDLGLHIGQDDLAVEAARSALGPERILGLSTHSVEQASKAIEQAKLLDYFAVGPVFATQTKPDYTPVGLQLVEQVAELEPRLPWFCIGGVNRGNARRVQAAGAERIVVVSDVLCDEDTTTAVKALKAFFA